MALVYQDQDIKLVDQVISGNTEAFDLLFCKYKQMVFNVCLGILGSKDDAADVTQKTFLQVYKSISSFKNDSSFRTWLFRVATNASLQALRKQSRRQQYPLVDDIPAAIKPCNDRICVVHNRLVIAPSKKTSLDISGNITLEIAPHTSIALLDSNTKNSIQVRAKIGERVTVAGIGERIMYGLHGDYLSSYTADNNLYPQFTLLDDKGKSLTSVTTEYTFHVWTDNLFDANLPTLNTGKCTLQFSVDTKTALGKLVAKKRVLVRDPVYRNAVITDYQTMVNSGNQHDLEKAKSEMLKKLFVGSVLPGKPYDILYRRYGEYPTKDKLSGIIKWYQKNDYLQVMVDVIDDFFSTDAYEGKYYRASSVELYIDPTGTSSNQIVVIPKGKNGIAAVTTTQKSIDISKVKANYKRTAKGYAIDVRIPWGILSGYSRGWKLMPVGAFINSRTGEDRTQLNFAESPDPYSDAALVPEQKSDSQLR